MARVKEEERLMWTIVVVLILLAIVGLVAFVWSSVF